MLNSELISELFGLPLVVAFDDGHYRARAQSAIPLMTGARPLPFSVKR
jgi:hypothetical protein